MNFILPVDFTSILQTLISGFILGSLYAIMTMGLSLIWSTVKILNFSHGAILMVGAYTAWALWSSNSFGLNFLIAFPLAVAIIFLIGAAIERSLIHPLRYKPAAEVNTIIVTLSLAIFLENLILALFGPRWKQLPLLYEGLISGFGVTISYQEIIVAVVALSTLAIIWLFLGRTREGMAMRAVAQDLDVSNITGINVDKTYLLVLGLGSALAGMAGILLSQQYFLSPSMGWAPLLKGLVIAIFAGAGSIKGTIYASYILGIVEAISALYLGMFWSLAIFFLFMIIILLIKPTGLYGMKEVMIK